MLEGNELEGKLGDVGSYAVDVTENGKVKVSLSVEKDFGYGKVSSVNALETDIFRVAREITKKTAATWDDQVELALEKLLGIKREEEPTPLSSADIKT